MALAKSEKMPGLARLAKKKAEEYGAFWRRPGAYLDPQVRAGISTFATMSSPDLHRGLSRLAADLADGSWEKRHRDLLELDEIDLGYRLIVAAA